MPSCARCWESKAPLRPKGAAGSLPGHSPLTAPPCPSRNCPRPSPCRPLSPATSPPRSMRWRRRAPCRPGSPRGAITVEPPRDPAHGDLATNAAMVLAKPAKTNPRALAEALAAELAKAPRVTGVEDRRARASSTCGWRARRGTTSCARSPRLGARLRPLDAWAAAPRSTSNMSRPIPTGPMHMGHCRGAVVGDALASLLEFAGHPVIARILCQRCRRAGPDARPLGASALPRGAGRGRSARSREGSIRAIIWCRSAQALAAEFGDRYAAAPESEWLDLFRTRAVAAMMDMIRADLALLGIHHDVFASEAEVQDAGQARGRPRLAARARPASTTACSKRPRASCPTIGSRSRCRCSARPGSATTRTGRSRKSDGSWTYFGADLAYHCAEGARAPTRWSTSGAPTMPARSSGSRRRSRR